MRLLCLLVALALLSVLSSCGARSYTQPGDAGGPHTTELAEFVFPAKELRSDCRAAAQDGLAECYSTVLATLDGTVMASGRDLSFVQTWHRGEVCRAPVACSHFLVSSDVTWCMLSRRFVHGGEARLDFAYSADAGATWYVAEANPLLLAPAAVGLPSPDGFMLADLDGQTWIVRRGSGRAEVLLRRVGGPAPRTGDLYFFSVERVCSQRRRDSSPFVVDAGDIFCRERNDARWVAFGHAELVRAASGPGAWWAVTKDGRLFHSPIDPRDWREVVGDSAAVIGEISPDGSQPGGLVALVKTNKESYVVRLDGVGRVVARISASFDPVAINAEGGRVAVVAGNGGTYLLDTDSWRAISPGCLR